MKSYFFIINTRAGKKSNKGLIPKLHKLLDERKVSYQYHITEYAGHATELARKAASENYQIIVAVGGDGTVNEVAKGLMGTDVPLGIIPLGSGNGLARELNISTNLKKAINTILYGNEKWIDVWQLNGNIFLCTAGIGFDSIVAYKMTQLKRRGKWSYVWLTIKESLKYKPLTITIRGGDTFIEQKIFLLSFANARQYGNNAFIAPKAKVDDGQIDLVLINPLAKVFYPIFALSLFFGIIDRLKPVKILRGNSFVIEKASANKFHIDGESLKLEFPVNLAKMKNQLEIRVP